MIGLSFHLVMLSVCKCFLTNCIRKMITLTNVCPFIFHTWIGILSVSLFRQQISSFLSLIYNQQLANIKCRGFQFVFTSVKSKCKVLLEQNITLCLKVNNYPENLTFESQSLKLAWLGQISEINFFKKSRNNTPRSLPPAPEEVKSWVLSLAANGFSCGWGCEVTGEAATSYDCPLNPRHNSNAILPGLLVDYALAVISGFEIDPWADWSGKGTHSAEIALKKK